MNRLLLATCAALLTLIAAPARAALTIEQVMADPDWIGAPIEHPYWNADSTSIYYQLKRSGGPIRDLHRIPAAGGADQIVDAAAMAEADAGEMVYDREHRRAAFVRNGDIFVRDLNGGRLTQITRSSSEETAVQFSADGRSLQYRHANDWFVHDFVSGFNAPAATLKLEKDPGEQKPDALRDLQLRWFSTLKQAHEDKVATRKHAEEMQRGDTTRAPLPLYLGDDIQISQSALSPSGRWLLLVTAAKSHDNGKLGKLTRYVTESGYEEFEDERTRVGRNDPQPQSLLLIDLEKNEKFALSQSSLPGIKDDPLAEIRARTEAAMKKSAAEAGTPAKKTDSKAKPNDAKERPLTIGGLLWSRDGTEVAIVLRAIDNKDRWIARVDFSTHALQSMHRLTDNAWINWNYNDFGWEPDNRTLWYLSEETGYSHLYTRAIGAAKAQALTRGEFEVSHVDQGEQSGFFYFRANREKPYAHDVYRVAAGGGEIQRLTQLQGVENFALSGDGKQLLLTHSSSYVPRQLSIAPSDGSGAPRALTDARSAAFKAIDWLAPEIVGVPSTHTKLPIWSKLYKPRNFDPTKKYPAVLFVHGAGYLQNTHLGYPNYFREQMFHNLLTEHGYIVLDMDYRASEGYGRDWRTAIYRQMGHPELEDLLDGKAWLVKNQSVDGNKIGMYGGSYGGFMTLMALFRTPDEFAAGAALRPVTDWTQYNHEYTSNILNTPQVDDESYRASSPLEFAEGLKRPLLICHGMIDDNVLFEDSVRLYQRLIELHKDAFEIAPYPMDRHGFTHADSWLDEYKRIFKLFEANLK